jgi:hypothetical protein
LKKRPKFAGLWCGEITGTNTVAERLYDKHPHAKRAGAMFDDPIFCFMNPAAGKWFKAIGEPTSIAVCSHSLVPPDYGAEIVDSGILTSASSLYRRRISAPRYARQCHMTTTAVFRGVVDAWTANNRGVGQIRTWILAALAQLGIEPNDLPPDLF